MNACLEMKLDQILDPTEACSSEEIHYENGFTYQVIAIQNEFINKKDGDKIFDPVPKMSFEFQGKVYEIGSKSLLESCDMFFEDPEVAKNLSCIAFMSPTDVDSDVFRDSMLLGVPFLKSFYTVFNAEGPNPTISFAQKVELPI